MGFEFIPLGDIQDDPDAIVARLRSVAGQDDEPDKADYEAAAVEDTDALVAKKVTELRDLVDDLELVKRASANLAVQDEALFPRKDDRSIHRHGNPH